MTLVEVGRRFEPLDRRQRGILLDGFIRKAFVEERYFSDRLQFNARLVTYLREEGLWPPKGSK